ncbi:MAG: penicillin-binding protein 2 [Candidatus Dactylopiibacterium carminicum]|uniref:Peptidoglycan D,D-transpeptidase MrdA n=1 Tax=Candidatus Dactylopiibacterium carminicum TaxID=857335 RepID=A0A272EWQ3_9RHOO|nr:penicillin-binding protein 2 [Candidatus Dactylopiibacterium carminicum]KAF7600063.1 penicillin-binding protein 2 [Candidatus Dactylopiibacterium carminicum]PAS94547.1 MAG: penicillin-binding protein 2 [Candidatus Dactylopiibacterium carminicum]PAS97586.1 MAG: penicillin-binding protein 2 [Candidatus Dactylopiibacterium carminicum]PAT00065.1 MAG: penicillin-binding protein 2 [Candidatus Dactylopiibacterium carminicum]
MELKAPEQELSRFRTRVLAAAGFVLFGFCLILARYFYLQVMQHEYYATRAENNRISLLPIAPNRGLIVDCNGVVLARNYSAYTLEITPSKVINLEDTIDELAEIIDIQVKDRRRFRKLLEESKNFESLPIRTRLSDEEVARFIARRYRFPGVDIKARLFRQYPQGELAAHSVGYIGRINQRELAMLEEDPQVRDNYRGTEYIGKTGLEQSYENWLHGVAGYEQLEVDASGRAVRSLSRVPPTPGQNLQLTLDVGLQRVAEEAFGGRRGALVAIEPGTGGVLALVSTPKFDPNLFVDGITVENWDALNTSPNRPMINRALNGVYPPGSTFKPFMALAALETGKRTAQQTIFDPGYFEFGNNIFRDSHAGGRGAVDMVRSLEISSDTYYYMLANDMGIDMIAGFMSKFGFGAATGIDVKGESIGVLPSPEWKRKRFRKPEQQRWYAGETISIGIGQGYNAYTPLQLAHATATLAADGVMYRPHLVKYVTDPQTGTQRKIEPEPVATLGLKPENLAVVRKGMQAVNISGTGANAFRGAPYAVAGKTGTAQVFSLRGAAYKDLSVGEHLRDHALYIAYAPVEKPVIALAILVENGGWGASIAAPLARQVLDYYLLGIKPKSAAQVDTEAGD